MTLIALSAHHQTKLGPAFGDAGMAYLFADRRQDPPAVAMLRQCG